MARSLKDMFIIAVLDEQKKIAEGAVSVKQPSYDEYALLCGEWRGLQRALEILNDLIKGDDDGEI